MISIECRQGDSIWHKHRIGIPTASQFERILTPNTRKPSTQATAYRYELLSEWLIGVPHGIEAQGFMQRGTEMEPEAARWYAYERDVEVKEVGLVMRDDRMVACSPDRLVGEDGLLEVKCPAAHTHIRNMLEGMGGYIGQTQGCLWLTGRKWLDLLSYSPVLPPQIVRIERDEGFIDALKAAIDGFVDGLLRERERLLKMGCVPADRVALPAGAMAMGESPF